MSGIRGGHEQIQTRWRMLQQQWRTSCGLWNDPVRHRFEREFWREWEQVVPATLDAMQQLAEVVNAARRAVR